MMTTTTHSRAAPVTTGCRGPVADACEDEHEAIADERVHDHAAMERFAPPHAPLAMPLQDLTPHPGRWRLRALLHRGAADV